MRPTCYSTPLLALVAALLLAVPSQAQEYGIGVTLEVPEASGDITLDGVADEAAWDEAAEVDLTQFFNSGFYDECAPNEPTEGETPDIAAFGRLLYSDGALYVFAEIEDYNEPFWGNGEPYLGDQIYVGVDLTHAGDDQIDEGYEGWPANAPNFGPTVYKVSGDPELGITSNWGFNDVFPVDEGYVAGEVFVDEAAFTWGVEMAIYGDEIATGNEIGFNIGGASGHPDCATAVEDAYAYYSWQAFSTASGGGDVMNNAGSFATLALGGGTASEGGLETPGFAIRANVPNPFRGTTALAYELARPGTVELAVYDVLGRRVGVLDVGARAAGEHPAMFDASALPGGVYTVRLAIDGAAVATRQVTQLK